MGKVYSAPDSIEKPVLDWKNLEAYRVAEAKYREDLKALLIERNPSPYVGETVKFPMADSYAEYMVAATSPLQLVHLELGDAWSFPYVERLTAKDIKAKIDGEKKLNDYIAEQQAKRKTEGN